MPSTKRGCLRAPARGDGGGCRGGGGVPRGGALRTREEAVPEEVEAQGRQQGAPAHVEHLVPELVAPPRGRLALGLQARARLGGRGAA